jgi:hypothetical protein
MAEMTRERVKRSFAFDEPNVMHATGMRIVPTKSIVLPRAFPRWACRIPNIIAQSM